MIPAPTVALTENGLAFTATTVTLPLTLTTGTGALSGNSTVTSGGSANLLHAQDRYGGYGRHTDSEPDVERRNEYVDLCGK